MASIGIAAAALEVMVRSEAVTGKDPGTGAPVPGYVYMCQVQDIESAGPERRSFPTLAWNNPAIDGPDGLVTTVIGLQWFTCSDAAPTVPTLAARLFRPTRIGTLNAKIPLCLSTSCSGLR
ncbi:hypothetical protein C8J57DRAFT_1236769 [Mycena rebaudengoi]|nr:hypothetical protein C8J57DRAFT_1236769 [Mycena rebaudengoi]